MILFPPPKQRRVAILVWMNLVFVFADLKLYKKIFTVYE